MRCCRVTQTRAWRACAPCEAAQSRLRVRAAAPAAPAAAGRARRLLAVLCVGIGWPVWCGQLQPGSHACSRARTPVCEAEQPQLCVGQAVGQAGCSGGVAPSSSGSDDGTACRCHVVVETYSMGFAGAGSIVAGPPACPRWRGPCGSAAAAAACEPMARMRALGLHLRGVAAAGRVAYPLSASLGRGKSI